MPVYHINQFNRNFFVLNQIPSPEGIGVHMCETHWESEPHMHENPELLFVARGIGSIRISDVEYDICTGDLIVVNPRQVHQERFRSMVGGTLLYHCRAKNVRIADMPDRYILPDKENPVIAAKIWDQSVIDCFQGMLDEAYRHTLGNTRICRLYMQEIVLIALRLIYKRNHADEMAAVPSIGMKTKQYICEHYEQPISLKMIAHELHISEYYLSHLFRQKQGMTPMEYLHQCRMDQAEILLTTTNQSIQDIAESIGYDRSSQLRVFFKRTYQMTPVQYRKNMKRA